MPAWQQRCARCAGVRRRETRDLRDRLASEREAAGRTRQYDQQRLDMVNTELEKLADRWGVALLS